MQGTAMVEFAIVVWLLVVLVLGFVEIGRALYQHNTLHEALAVGPRYLARVPDIVTLDSGASPPCSWNGASSALTDAKNLVIYGQLGVGTPVLEGFEPADITISNPAYYAEGSGTTSIEACVIHVAADINFNSLFGGLIPIPVTLNADAEERYIGQ